MLKNSLQWLPALALVATSLPAAAVTERDVADHYAVLAHAVYADALDTAKDLKDKIDSLVASPSEQTLADAKQAWVVARKPYQQSEVFRFGNPVVDEWEGQLNAWPLDEGLIDYVAPGYHGEMGNIGSTLNIIASPTITLGDETIDTSKLTPELLASFNELGGSEANVATGYHAIEFLLWGQDLNGTNPGAGNRPYTDYATGDACTHAPCERRIAYLKAAVDLLVQDLEYMEDQWSTDGDYRNTLKTLDEQEVITRALYGMGSLSLGELAGERLKVALEASSPEDEHDCFSDNTHNAHFFDALGIQNVYLGRYRRTDDTLLSGPSLADLTEANAPQLNQKMRAALATTQADMQALVDSANQGVAFDQLIAEGNTQGHKLITDAIAALVTQTQLIEDVSAALGIESLNPDTADHAF